MALKVLWLQLIPGWAPLTTLPLDSVNAAEILCINGVCVDLIHIDGGHDFRSVVTDLTVWWPRLRGGGILIGDD